MPPTSGSRDDEEQRLVDMIVEYAQLKHVLVMHQRPALTEQGWRTAIQGDEGFLDLTLAGPGGVAFAECKKRVGGQLSDGQIKWMDMLTAARGTHEVLLWTMAHWENGEIQELIDFLARVPLAQRMRARDAANRAQPKLAAPPPPGTRGQELVASAAPLPVRPTRAPRTPPPASGQVGYEPDVELANGEHIPANIARTLGLPLANGSLVR